MRDRKSKRLNSRHRDLHSFPTRRSSDLRGRTDVPRIVDWYMEKKINIDDLITHRLPLERINERSEEQTSELPSPRSTLFPYTTLFRSSRPHGRAPYRRLVHGEEDQYR